MDFGLLTLLRPLIGAWSWVQTRLGLSRDHDVANFRKLDALADESTIDNLINSRIYNRRITLADGHLLDDFILALQRIENRFLDHELQKYAESLSLELNRLRASVQASFFSVGEGRLKFRPDFIDPKVYDAEWQDILHRIENAWNAYKTYRLAVKERLKV
jgi:hypothetical protein